jgi:DNA polymerase III psi subunit
MGLKPPDWMCLPMTSDQHAQLHAQGEASYWREHGEDPLALIAMTMLVYLAAHPSVELVEALGRIVEA